MRTQDLYLYTLNTIKQDWRGGGVLGGFYRCSLREPIRQVLTFGVLDVSDAVLPIRIRWQTHSDETAPEIMKPPHPAISSSLLLRITHRLSITTPFTLYIQVLYITLDYLLFRSPSKAHDMGKRAIEKSYFDHRGNTRWRKKEKDLKGQYLLTNHTLRCLLIRC